MKNPVIIIENRNFRHRGWQEKEIEFSSHGKVACYE